MAFAMPNERRADRMGRRVAVALAAGAATALFLGLYGDLHPPGGQTTFKMLFDSMLAFKSWFTTASLSLAVTQVVTGLRVRDKIRWPRTIPIWMPDVHRLLGTLALLASLPVAYHCLWSLGFTFNTAQPRVFIHAVAGCVFYGAFVTKVLAIRLQRVPEWLVPVAGGVTFGLLVVVWLTSSAFFLTGHIG